VVAESKLVKSIFVTALNPACSSIPTYPKGNISGSFETKAINRLLRRRCRPTNHLGAQAFDYLDARDNDFGSAQRFN
jgi:hypothetical protein